jgi:ferredoxin
MANPNDKYSENAAGAWYVDTTCIDCGMCAELAPSVFRYSETGAQNYVYHQPVIEKELDQAEKAREGCPVDAIGKDGIADLEPHARR